MCDSDTSLKVKVVVNQEQQFSIWPVYLSPPAGWNDIGVMGTRSECLEFIRIEWTNMTPLSVRRTCPAPQIDDHARCPEHQRTE